VGEKKGVDVKIQDSRRKTSDLRLETSDTRLRTHISCLTSHVSCLLSLVTRHSSLSYVLRLVSCILVLTISAFSGQKAVCASNMSWPDKTGWDSASDISGDNSNTELELAVSEKPRRSLVEVLQSIKRGIRPVDRRRRVLFKGESKGSIADLIHGSPRGEPEAKARLLSPRHRLFTPNGDGVNDTIEIRVSLGEMPSVEPELRIYDLTGYRIYSDHYPRSIGIDDNGSYIFSFTWDGDPPVDGRQDMASTGMYIYAIKAGNERFSGTITTISDGVRLGE
jgi:hypothetical protein